MLVQHFMGFLESYRRLPRYQRILLGLTGVVVGWYGPSVMHYLFGETGVFKARTILIEDQLASTALNTEKKPPKDNN